MSQSGKLKIYLVRHGETGWSLSGRHTGRTEVELTEMGRQEAGGLKSHLGELKFDAIWRSPRRRAEQTCELAGFGARAEIDPDLAEWDYGDYEGLRSTEILPGRPDWNIFRMGCPGGESPEQISARADRVIARLRIMQGSVAVFSHGHFLRVLSARWIGLPLVEGRKLLLDTGSVSVLGYERERLDSPGIVLWNDTGRILR